MFSRAGLPHTEPGQLRDFVTSDVLALSGNTTSFAREWRRLGDRDASRRFRGVVEYLLRGENGEDDDAEDDLPLPDRFTALAEGRSEYAMGGVREPVLTRILAVARPERFLPVLTVDGGSGGEGKRELARSVLHLELPALDRGRHTVGRVACGSNDLLVDAIGAGFPDLDDAAAFLLWAHAPGLTRARRASPAGRLGLSPRPPRPPPRRAAPPGARRRRRPPRRRSRRASAPGRGEVEGVGHRAVVVVDVAAEVGRVVGVHAHREPGVEHPRAAGARRACRRRAAARWTAGRP